MTYPDLLVVPGFGVLTSSPAGLLLRLPHQHMFVCLDPMRYPSTKHDYLLPINHPYKQLLASNNPFNVLSGCAWALKNHSLSTYFAGEIVPVSAKGLSHNKIPVERIMMVFYNNL
jgi:hypothetical protein